MLSFILSFAGWSYLPDLATRQLLSVFHSFYQSVLHRPIPAPNTPLYRRHYRYVYAFTVVGYLVYNFHDAAVSMPSNYYELLDVDPTADENALKLAFRQFARKNHPDRVGQHGEALFMEVRDAFEALKNPITRFAYDRFGPEALQWTQCTTLREFIRYGLMQSVGFHIVSACFLLLVSAVGKPSYVAFWRYLLFAAVFIYELTYILNPSIHPPSDISVSSDLFIGPRQPAPMYLFAALWPRRVPYQHVRFLHSLFMFMSIALSRVAPVLFPPPTDDHANAERLRGEVERIVMLSKMVERDLSSQIHTELHSVHGPKTGTQPTAATFTNLSPCEEPADAVIELLTAQMENMIIETQLMDGGPLKSAVDNAVERRRRVVPQEQKRPLGMGMPSPTPSPPPIQPSRLAERNQKSPARKAQFASSVSQRSQGYVRGRSQSC